MVKRKRLLSGATPLGLLVLSLGWFASLGVAQTAPPLVPYQWASVRIVGGTYVTGMIAHPTQPGLIYARTQTGGAYRWNGTTEEWAPLTDFHTGSDFNLQGVESIAIDPTDPTRLYIAAGSSSTGPTAFLVSTDQGATFTTYRTPGFAMASNSNGANAGERLAVNPSNPSELFMGTRSAGLWKSENRAQTWAKVSTFPVSTSNDGFGVNFVLFDPANSGTIYAGVYTTSTVYRSTDDGNTWSALPSQPLSWPFTVTGAIRPPEPLRAVLNPDGNLYVTYQSFEGPGGNPVGLTYGLVEKYNPSTNSWTNITPPLDTADGETTQTGGFCGITQDPNRQGTVAVATLNRYSAGISETIFVTHDGGNTWIDLGAITSAAGPYGSIGGLNYFGPSVFTPVSPWLGSVLDADLGFPAASIGYYLSALMIDPFHPDHFMFDTGGSIFGTYNLSAADSGKSPTWTVQAVGIEGNYVPAVISPTEGAHLLSAAFGGFRHDDLSVSPVGGLFSGSNFIYQNVSGIDWAGQNPLFVVSVGYPQFPSTGPCNWGGFSTDGGSTWTPFNGCAANAATTLDNPGTILVDASGTMIMWVPPGSVNSAQYSTDGSGGSWNLTTGLPNRLIPVADKVIPRTFYAYDGINFYSTTTSGGTTFKKVNTGTLSGSGAAVPVPNYAKGGDLWLPAASYGLYHSTDGGVTWKNLSSVLQANFVSVGAPNPRARNGVQTIFLYGVPAGTTSYGVYRSEDAGATWVQVSDGAHGYGGPISMVADTRVFGRVFLGTNGRGIVYGEVPGNPLGGGGLGPQ
jgi:oligoxyloglucan reducing-end-specific cellobiohydrolase